MELYRVVLEGIGKNSLEEKNGFCKNFSNHYSIPFEAVERIIKRFPVVIKKNLTREKATALAKNLKMFGATVSIQKKTDSPIISLEFQSQKDPRLVLDSASIRETQSGLMNLVGRVKNIFNKELSDIWVLIQIFDKNDEMINFEEVPIPINPLPSNTSSPFKVVFEKDIQFKKISIAFKNSSGFPILSIDGRKKKDWVDIEFDDINDGLNYRWKKETNILPNEGLDAKNNRSGKNIEETLAISTSDYTSNVEKILINDENNVVNSSPSFNLNIEKDETIKNEKKEDRLSLELEENNNVEITKKEYIFSFPWVEDFKKSIEEFYKRNNDIFIDWFNRIKDQKEFENDFHAVLTILINARFNQIEEAETALENTERVFKLILQPDLSLDKIPPIKGTQFFTSDEWRQLFYRAIPRIKDVAREIINKKQWEVLSLEKLIQTIPHMGERNSRLAIRWIKELPVDGVEIDISNAKILIGKKIYRVASRLGILNPNFDLFSGRDSMGDIKIQSFAKEVYPDDPTRIEEPMNWVGSESKGFCWPTEPNCLDCLFGKFCCKLYISFDPSEKGML